MARYLLVLLALVAKPWAACQSGLPGPTSLDTSTAREGTQPGELRTAPLPATTTTRFLHSSRFMPTDRPPTSPIKDTQNLTQNELDKQKLGAYYRTLYTGNATKSVAVPNPYPTSDMTSGRDVTKPLNQSHIRDSEEDVSSSMTTSSYYYDDLEKVPWRQGHTHHQTKQHHPQQPAQPPEREPTEKSGPYFRPPSAISHKYKNFRVEPGQMLDDIDPECWPHCRNSTRGSKRKRKHSSNKKRKYYNYKLLYDTLKGDLRRQETEFYAWIFGATMLTLGSLTTLTSCFVFCFCSEKWRKRRQTKRYDKSGQYQRVDSVSSMVDSHHESQDHQDQLDSVTII